MATIGLYSFTDTDVSRTFSNLGPWWEHLTGGVRAETTQPAGELLAEALSAALGAPRPPDRELGDELGALGKACARRFEGAESSSAAADALTHLWNGVRSATAAMRVGGAVPTSGSGTVVQLNTSDGGVPKRPVDTVEVNHSGIVGDRQGARQHHGRPWQALCLWSAEVIADFARDGNPIAAGSAGENITISGIDWAAMHPGMRLRVGTVLAETSAWAIPCRHNARWFTNGDFTQMSHERGPVGRIYATVIEPGAIRVDDTVTVEA